MVVATDLVSPTTAAIAENASGDPELAGFQPVHGEFPATRPAM